MTVPDTDSWRCSLCLRNRIQSAGGTAVGCPCGAPSLVQVPVRYGPTLFESLFDCPFMEGEVARCPGCATDNRTTERCHVTPCVACHGRIAARVVNSEWGRRAGAGASATLVTLVETALE